MNNEHPACPKCGVLCIHCLERDLTVREQLELRVRAHAESLDALIKHVNSQSITQLQLLVDERGLVAAEREGIPDPKRIDSMIEKLRASSSYGKKSEDGT